MRTIYADFNALTESESIRLTTRGSEEDIRQYGVRPGDWVWLSDGEMLVGARVEEDPRDRLVGSPAWDTLVDLIDDPPVSLSEIETELNTLIGPGADSASVDEHRVLQLLTWWERKSPNAREGAASVTARRAFALMDLGHNALALGLFKDALEVDPNNPDLISAHLILLTKTEPAQALREAEFRMRATDPSANVVAACVNALSSHTEGLSGEELYSACRRVLMRSMAWNFTARSVSSRPACNSRIGLRPSRPPMRRRSRRKPAVAGSMDSWRIGNLC